MTNKRVVLIDGDRYILRMYEQLLTGQDFEVITASDGDRGLFLVKENLPAVVVSELKLERQSGLEVLKKMKKDNDTKNIPVIILTNSFERENVKAVLAAGADKYLIKAHHAPTEVVDVIIQATKNN